MTLTAIRLTIRMISKIIKLRKTMELFCKRMMMLEAL